MGQPITTTWVDGISNDALDASPEAFAAVDNDLRVIRWNKAAEKLTGFTAEQALGGPLPHLTGSQQTSLRQAAEHFEDWQDNVPVVFPRRHANGNTIQVCVTRYVRLNGADGQAVGFGSFFRAVRSTDTRTHLRNVYSQRLASSVRPEDALKALQVIIGELLPGDRGYFIRREDGRWRGQLSVGDNREVAEGIVVDDPVGVDVALTSRSCLITSMVIGGTPTTVMAVPAGPESAGIMLVLIPGQEEVEEAEQELAIALASEAWATLRRVEAVSELEGKVEILEAIAGVASAAGLDHEEVFGHVARYAASALSCERAALYLWNGDHSALDLVAFHAADREWPVDDDLHEAGRAAALEMFSTVEPFLTQDTRTCPWLAGPWDYDQGAVSVYGMPLSIGADDLGVLVVAHTTANPRGFTSLCTQVGSALSRQAALAISNARLYAAQRDAADRFRDIDRQRADWVAGITHDLRTPVTAILGFARTLERAAGLMSEEDRADALDVIQRQALRTSRMLDDMMDSARAEAGVLGSERHGPVPLQQTVADAVLVTTPEDRLRLTVQVDPNVVVQGDHSQLSRVVQNLVVNALYHAPGNKAVTVTGYLEGHSGVLVVADHGPGIPADVDVFNRFARGGPGGTGLGMYTVKRILELHQGTIELERTPGGGTTARVRLPLAR